MSGAPVAVGATRRATAAWRSRPSSPRRETSPGSTRDVAAEAKTSAWNSPRASRALYALGFLLRGLEYFGRAQQSVSERGDDGEPRAGGTKRSVSTRVANRAVPRSYCVAAARFFTIASLERGLGTFQGSNGLSPLASTERTARFLDRGLVAGAPGEHCGPIRVPGARVEANRRKDNRHERCVPEHVRGAANLVPVDTKGHHKG